MKNNKQTEVSKLETLPEDTRYKGSILIPSKLIPQLTEGIYQVSREGKKDTTVLDYLVIDGTKVKNCLILTHRNKVLGSTSKSVTGKSGVKAKVLVSNKNTSISKYCPNCGVQSTGKYCISCGSKQ